MRRLTPEEKVRITIELTDAATRITAQGIRDSHPGITEEQVIEELRRRVALTRRTRGEG
jgi:hypothetical protein